MNRKSDRKPQNGLRYLRHSRWDSAFVYLRADDGARRQIHLGRFDSPESWQRFHQLGAWLARGEAINVENPWGDREHQIRQGDHCHSKITIEKLASKFLRFADGYYRKPNGASTRELPNFVLALRPLLKLFRHECADSFGPLRLKAVREAMVEGTYAKKGRGWSRNYVNKQIGRIRLMFKWAVSEELIEPAVLQGLQTVSGLKRGRTRARESGGKPPVALDVIAATAKCLSKTLAAMVEAQYLIGCRPSEIVHMRGCEIDTSGEMWLFRPERHKVQHHDHRDLIYPIGPRCKCVLQGFMKGDPQAFLFDPRIAEKERRKERRKTRLSKVQPSQVLRARRSREHPSRRLNPSYSVDSYSRAIRRACERAGVSTWSPIQIRKRKATEVRRQYGLEASQVVLNHAKADVTQLYALRDLKLASKVARETG